MDKIIKVSAGGEVYLMTVAQYVAIKTGFIKIDKKRLLVDKRIKEIERHGLLKTPLTTRH